jgi:hypothetical protein
MIGVIKLSGWFVSESKFEDVLGICVTKLVHQLYRNDDGNLFTYQVRTQTQFFVVEAHRNLFLHSRTLTSIPWPGSFPGSNHYQPHTAQTRS